MKWGQIGGGAAAGAGAASLPNFEAWFQRLGQEGTLLNVVLLLACIALVVGAATVITRITVNMRTDREAYDAALSAANERNQQLAVDMITTVSEFRATVQALHTAINGIAIAINTEGVALPANALERAVKGANHD